jgi:hypothetical protein
VTKFLILIKRKHLLKEKEISVVNVCVTNTRRAKCPEQQKYCNKFAGSISQWKFITLKAQYTTVDYN